MRTSEKYETRQARPGACDLAAWADSALARPAVGGADLEQRHVLDEAAHPETVEALRRLAAAA
ncbi:hypothetical protein [Kitasatospora sp. DSM 101779]|uniref:hypothetical protein n=1 Tax=Kitasatospora sp. DSM 101779 TaxID=2853165 RepID=UPI0021D92E02|nr:hypothetical protein [Kitasatospora sp. DSM 101779]MCU7827328.1 hypothetical protein [Kitasatospora sp. DSM 101779]MCU7827411.1 hypothetical protein [Kitasatospora sp. DSM 101779]